jgi:hypothetical protein
MVYSYRCAGRAHGFLNIMTDLLREGKVFPYLIGGGGSDPAGESEVTSESRPS